LQAPDHLVRNLRVPLDDSGIDPRLAEVAQPGQERLTKPGRLRCAAGMRVDQVQPQAAEEQLLTETGSAPLRLTRLLGDLPGVLLTDFSGNGHRGTSTPLAVLESNP